MTLIHRLAARILERAGWSVVSPAWVALARRHGTLVLDDVALVSHATLARIAPSGSRIIPPGWRVYPPLQPPAIGTTWRPARGCRRYVVATAADSVTYSSLDGQPNVTVSVASWHGWRNAARAKLMAAEVSTIQAAPAARPPRPMPAPLRAMSEAVEKP